MHQTVTCVKCGWVYMGVPRKWAEQQVAEFNRHYDTLDELNKSYFGGPSSIGKDYDGCWCGSREFRPFKSGDCPDGVTIGPVIYEGDAPNDDNGTMATNSPRPIKRS